MAKTTYKRKSKVDTPEFPKWEYILREIEKCDLMCANCHWETHYPYTPS